jgi:hypothetical protein
MLAVSVTVVAAVTVMTAAVPRSAVAPLRVADFAALLANHANTGPRMGPDQAAQQLLRQGVPLGDPGATLTEGRLSTIMEFYGVRTETRNPDSVVNAERGSAVASILSATVLFNPGTEKNDKNNPGNRNTGSSNGNGDGDNGNSGNNGNNGQTGPGAPPTSDLSVCLSERNRGHCVNCCKDQGSPANACARFCREIEHPSPSSPR